MTAQQATDLGLHTKPSIFIHGGLVPHAGCGFPKQVLLQAWVSQPVKRRSIALGILRDVCAELVRHHPCRDLSQRRLRKGGWPGRLPLSSGSASGGRTSRTGWRRMICWSQIAPAIRICATNFSMEGAVKVHPGRLCDGNGGRETPRTLLLLPRAEATQGLLSLPGPAMIPWGWEGGSCVGSRRREERTPSTN